MLYFLAFWSSLLSQILSLDDLFSHQISSYSGDLQIEPDKQEVVGDISVQTRIVGDGHTSLVFLTPIPPEKVLNTDSSPLSYQILELESQTLIVVQLGKPLENNDQVFLRFLFQGKPVCKSNNPFNIKSCLFSKQIYLDLSSILPASLSGDFATLDLKVILKSGLKVVGSGEVVKIITTEDGKRIHYFVQEVSSFRHGLVAGDFVEGTLTLSDLKIRMYVSEDKKSLLGERLEEISDCISYYQNLFGSLPFKSLSIVEIDGIGAGIAMPGLILLPSTIVSNMGGGTLHPDDLHFLVIPHELAHQWFGGAITFHPLSGPLLLEGLAEFSAIHFIKQRYGDQMKQDILKRYSYSYRYLVPQGEDHPIGQWALLPKPQSYYHIAYEKTACVLETIKNVVGDFAFFEGIQRMFQNETSKQAFIIKQTFLGYLESSSGQSLKDVSQAWIDGTGYPILTVKVTSSKSEKPPYPIVIDIFVESSISGNQFVMPTLIRINTIDGARDFIEFLAMYSNRLTYFLESPFLSVEIDPKSYFIKRIEPYIKGDVDLSGEVDGIDLLRVAWSIGRDVYSQSFPEEADLDMSSDITVNDLDIVINHFGFSN